jgi:hypothetical protein
VSHTYGEGNGEEKNTLAIRHVSFFAYENACQSMGKNCIYDALDLNCRQFSGGISSQRFI